MLESMIQEILQKHAHRHAKVPDDLLQLLAFDKKNAIEKHCRSFVLKQSALVSLILHAPKLGYEHLRQHREFQPPHLNPTDTDLRSLRESAIEKREKVFILLNEDVEDVTPVNY